MHETKEQKDKKSYSVLYGKFCEIVLSTSPPPNEIIIYSNLKFSPRNSHKDKENLNVTQRIV